MGQSGKQKNLAAASVRQARELNGFLTIFGTLGYKLKKWWILHGVMLLAAIVAVVAPRYFIDAKGQPDPAWTPWLTLIGVVAALAVFLDKVADSYEKAIAANKLRASEDTAENAVSDLNTLLSEANRISFLEGTAREKAIATLKRIATMCAAKAIGPGTRATYYTLQYDPTDNSRILGSPEHTCEYGRYDKPKRPFIERSNPGHSIWRVMDGPDEEPEVRHVGEVIDDLDWGTKKYDTFISVPVKSIDVQFGLLSVNNSNDGSIGNAQRAAILAMARTMALVLSMVEGPRNMNALTGSAPMSPAGASLKADDNGGIDE